MSALQSERLVVRPQEALPQLRALTSGYPLGASPEALVLMAGGMGDLESTLVLEREAKRLSEGADGRMLSVWAREMPRPGVKEQKCQLKAVVHGGAKGDRERALKALRELYRAQGEEELYACAALQAAEAGDEAYLPLRDAVRIAANSSLKTLVGGWLASMSRERPSLLLAQVKYWFASDRVVEASEAAGVLGERYPESPEALLGQSYIDFSKGSFREAEDGALAVYQETKGIGERAGLTTEALELACLSHVRRAAPGPSHERWMEKVLERDPESEVGWALCIDNYVRRDEPKWSAVEELIGQKGSVVGARCAAQAARERGEQVRAKRYEEIGKSAKEKRRGTPRAEQPIAEARTNAAVPLPVGRLSERIRAEYERAKQDGDDPRRTLMAVCGEFETLCLMLRRESKLFHLLGRSVHMVEDYSERVRTLRGTPATQLEWQMAMSSLYSAVHVESIESPFGMLWGQLRELKSCAEAIEPDQMVLGGLFVGPRVKGLADTLRLSYVECSRAFLALEGRRGVPRELVDLEARLQELRAELDGAVRGSLESGEELVKGFLKRFNATPLVQ